jgi:hypothetical protein
MNTRRLDVACAGAAAGATVVFAACVFILNHRHPEMRFGPSNNRAGEDLFYLIVAWWSIMLAITTLSVFNWRQRQMRPVADVFTLMLPLFALVFFGFIAVGLIAGPAILQVLSLFALPAFAVYCIALVAIPSAQTLPYAAVAVLLTLVLAFGGYLGLALLLFCC